MDRATIAVYAPGTVSNLGSGFDCLGIAFSGKGDRVSAARSDALRVLSVSDTRIPLDTERNTAAIAAQGVLRRLGVRGGVELRIEKGLPLAAGLGGSAASAVGGAFATNALFGSKLGTAELLSCALEAEAAVSGPHADNVTPALLGGGILVGGSPVVLSIHPSLLLVILTPDYEVETARARAVLPSSVARQDAVIQASRLASLVLGLERGDVDLIRVGTQDLIAEPARMHLYPGYAEARSAGLDAGAAGVCVSGAGPSVVALVPRGKETAIVAALQESYAMVGIHATPHIAEVDAMGARVTP